MSVQSFAPIVEHIDLTAGAAATTVGSGEKFRVYGMVAASAAGGASTITVSTADGTTTLFHWTMGATTTVVMNISFIADKGLAVSCATTDAHITILRGHSGT